jgi:hypothetical protein
MGDAHVVVAGVLTYALLITTPLENRCGDVDLIPHAVRRLGRGDRRTQALG